MHWPFRVRDGRPGSEVGIELEHVDGAVSDGTTLFLVETKHWGENLDIVPIVKLLAQLNRRPPAVLGIVLSWLDFTEPALVLVRRLPPYRVLLWWGSELVWAARESGRMRSLLAAKLESAALHAVPDHYVGDFPQ